MKPIFLFGFAVFFLTSCGESKTNSDTSSSDSANTEQQHEAADPKVAQDNSSSSNASNVTFKNVMDKTMQDMQSMQMTGDPDQDFATMMKRHHQGAIEMANLELSKGASADLKQVAQQTIDASQKDINDLNTFLQSHQPDKKSDFSKKMMDKMKSKSPDMNMNMDMGGNTDQQFAMMMSMHHQMGIDMARDYLKVASEEQTKKVANNTVKSNSEDLKKLKALSGNK